MFVDVSVSAQHIKILLNAYAYIIAYRRQIALLIRILPMNPSEIAIFTEINLLPRPKIDV